MVIDYKSDVTSGMALLIALIVVIVIGLLGG